jgi:membrane protease subunit HflC
MNAYVAALDGQGTTMVISPDSEFFRFFRNAEGMAPPATPAPPATATPPAAAAPADATAQ